MSIIKQIFELYLRKRATQDIEHNPPAALLLFFIMAAIATYSFSELPIFRPAVAAAVAAIGLELGIGYAFLHFHQKTSRFVQMITASMGVSVISQLLLLTMLPIPELAVLQGIIRIWGLYLSVVILKDVLECSFFKSLALVISATFISLIMLFGMFGDNEMIQQLQEQNVTQPNSSATSQQ